MTSAPSRSPARRAAPPGGSRSRAAGREVAAPGAAARRSRSGERRGPDHHGRISVLLCVMLLGLGAVGARLVDLQGLRSDQLREAASRERVTEATLPSLRGSVYDRSLSPLALSVQRRAVVANPREIRDPLEAAQRLSPILHEEAGAILPRLEGDRAFSYVVRAVDDAVAQQVTAASIPGINLIPETHRAYPAGSLGGAVLGITGVDGEGLEGLEYRYDSVLAGRPGRVVEERDPAGRPIAQAPSTLIPSVPGRSLVLTLDEALQYQVESILDAGVARAHAKGGTAIVMDPRTGEILALANSPGFSPSDFAKVKVEDRRNRAVTDVFEPGSTNKVITMAAALEAKALPPGQHIDVPDHLRVGSEDDAIFSDAEAHRAKSWTMEDILVESSNVGTIKVAQLVGGRRLDQYFAAFGYGRTTGVDFPGEAEGIVLPYDEWSETSIATIPIGQGIATSALQMCLVYATLANDGVRPVPTLVKGLAAGGTRVEPLPSQDVPRRIVSSDTAYRIRHMLAQVVERGTGVNAAVDGYSVAGKTGTARIPGPTGYTDKYVASFVGFAPVESPSLVVSVSIHEPDPSYHGYFGGDVAAPVFSEIIAGALRHNKVPPHGKDEAKPEGKPDRGA